jgi:group I intron endonuclease
MYSYFDAKYLMRNDYMIICKALLKYGYSNFKLEILEYCKASDVIAREQFYITSLRPEYNQLKTAGSLFGFRHTEETKAQISAARKGKPGT